MHHIDHVLLLVVAAGSPLPSLLADLGQHHLNSPHHSPIRLLVLVVFPQRNMLHVGLELVVTRVFDEKGRHF